LQTGQRFHSEPIHVYESDIIAFARLYDPQAFHTDPDAARQTVFGGLLAPGLYTLCLTFAQYFRLQRWDGFGSPGLDQVRWLIPLRPGDSIQVETVVVSLRESRSKPDRGIVVIRHETYNQDHDMVMSLECTDFVRRRQSLAINTTET
jgi:acyl dehydratase